MKTPEYKDRNDTVPLITLQLAIIAILSSTQTSLIFSMQPVFAAIYAYFAINERLGYWGILGALFVLAGMVISQFLSRSNKAINQGAVRAH